jgi:dissimilatory sulfite reductase (desulfoviridin) alpha/beta subunit
LVKMTKLRGAMGLLAQKQRDYVTVRLTILSGKVSSSQLRRLANITENEGAGFLILTMRKGIEVPWIKTERALDVIREFNASGLKGGSCGTRVRTILACAGLDRCPFALIDTGELCSKISSRYYGKEMPTKFKVSIAGCQNCCSHPHINDFGIICAVKPRINPEKCIDCGQCLRLCRGKAIKEGSKGLPEIDFDKCIDCGWCIKNCPTSAIKEEKSGYTIIIGGKSGRRPKLGEELTRLATEEEVLVLLDKTLNYFKKYADGKERLSEILERLGMEHFRFHVLGKWGR